MDLDSLHAENKAEFLHMAKAVLSPEQGLEIDFITEGEAEVSDAIMYELLRGWGSQPLIDRFLQLPTVFGSSYTVSPESPKEPAKPVVLRTFDDEFA